MKHGPGLLDEFKEAVEGGKRMRSSHVRSMLCRKGAGRKERMGNAGRASPRAPRQAGEAAA